MLLALDISTISTGWAFGGKGGPEVFGSFNACRPSDLPKRPGPRYARYREFLSDRVKLLRPRAIVYEAPLPPKSMNSADTARQLFTLGGLTEEIAAEFNVPYIGEIAISTVKAWFAGHGHADKDDMILECFARGWKPANGDEADAMALHTYAAASPALAPFLRASAQGVPA